VRLLLLVSLALTIVIAGCTTQEPVVVKDNHVPFRVLSEGTTSGWTQQKLLTLRSAREFTEFWGVHRNGNLGNLPKINFKKQMVIAVCMGERRTGGYAIQIKNIINAQKALLVDVVVTRPRPGSTRIMMINQPHMVVVLPRIDKAVKFKLRSGQ
jgi:hypothetical protein